METKHQDSKREYLILWGDLEHRVWASSPLLALKDARVPSTAKDVGVYVWDASHNGGKGGLSRLLGVL